ncbi:MAG: mechanosensitive ion channel, partial [Comamonadaceae bacterium]
MQDSAFMVWIQETTFIGIPLWSWLIALAAAMATYVGIRMVLRVLRHRTKAWAVQSDSAMAHAAAEVLAGTSRLLVLMVALLVGANLLDLPGRWESRLSQLWFVAVALQMGLWGMRAIGMGVHRYVQRHSSSGMTQVSASATLLSWGLRTLLWSIVLLAILSNVGVNITAFIASLGVGGIAVALAVQNILGDLFASLAIAVDKPFEVGDFIVVG